MILNLITALLLGAAIGLEREAYERRINTTKRSGIGSLGVRSYSLITLLGALAGITYHPFFPVFVAITIAFICLLIIYYVMGSIQTKDVGMTTELAIFLSYLFGVFIGSALLPVQLVIALTVVLILILSVKDEIQIFIRNIKEYEMDSFISFAIIVFVVYPYLPNISYSIGSITGLSSILQTYHLDISRITSLEIINPYQLWRVVVLITGIEIFGYLLNKTVGNKHGWLFTSIAGGFISSTSTTQSLAVQSKKSKEINKLTASALLANVASFVQHFILLGSINALLLVEATWYISALLVTALICSMFFIFQKDRLVKRKAEKEISSAKEGPIFSLKPALQFAFLFLVIKFISKLSLVFLGSGGFYITVALSSLAGIDAITITIAEMFGNTLSGASAPIGIMIANTVNLLAKSVYAYIGGSKKFALQFTLSIFIIILLSAIPVGLRLFK